MKGSLLLNISVKGKAFIPFRPSCIVKFSQPKLKFFQTCSVKSMGPYFLLNMFERILILTFSSGQVLTIYGFYRLF